MPRWVQTNAAACLAAVIAWKVSKGADDVLLYLAVLMSVYWALVK